MSSRTKFICLLLGILVASWIGYSFSRYFLENSSPVVAISGVESDRSYAGDIQCEIAASHRYKIGDISVWLDAKPLVQNFKINRSSCKHPFVISSRPLANGKHTLKVEVCDGSHKRNKISMERSFNVDNVPLQAAFIRPDTDVKVLQGRTLHLQFQANKKLEKAFIKVFSREFACSQESEHSTIYECFVPVSCDQIASEYPLTIDLYDQVGNQVVLEGKFQVISSPFKRQTIKVDQEKLNQEKKLGRSQTDLDELINKANQASPRKKLWKGSFITPLESLGITTEFGVIRTSQEKGRYQHNAIDYVGNPKCVVWAAQDGNVVVKDRFEKSGNTVVIDHGLGILTLYFHLDSFADIKEGDFIKKGQPVGKMGKTGYATGDHLHYEMRVEGMQVDPLQWIRPDF